MSVTNDKIAKGPARYGKIRNAPLFCCFGFAVATFGGLAFITRRAGHLGFAVLQCR